MANGSCPQQLTEKAKGPVALLMKGPLDAPTELLCLRLLKVEEQPLMIQH